VKTSLKLLLVFVEYTESNSLLLLAVVNKAERGRSKQEERGLLDKFFPIDQTADRQDWHSIMRILNERQASDEETLVYAMTVINKTLSGIPDQDTFFDVVDVLESQGIEDALAEMLKLNNQQLTQQCMLYENELKREDAVMAADDGGVESQLVKMRCILCSVLHAYTQTYEFNQLPDSGSAGLVHLHHRHTYNQLR
jgi:hypothetical protein